MHPRSTASQAPPRWFPIRLFHPPYGNIVQRLSMRLYLGRQKGH